MADLSCRSTNRKCSSFAMKHFQRKSLKIFNLHPPLRRLVLLWHEQSREKQMLSNRHTHTQTNTQTHRPSTVTLAVHARRRLTTYYWQGIIIVPTGFLQFLAIQRLCLPLFFLGQTVSLKPYQCIHLLLPEVVVVAVVVIVQISNWPHETPF